ncbi:MaoC family dehydratase [Acidimangrovimonas sediminis]|uniref:MaoC family dehydratase n=1 Tax=Acidimangrovimonas sediminis TaxID=2056283 RepID=UPI000C7F9B6F|nr:MaoC family dehydratase [Acidimangrovimonas sediminis]
MDIQSRIATPIGSVAGPSRWFPVDQGRIDAFADLTEDRQFIHVDSDRARQTPFGGTIAHGFLTLSLLSAMLADCRLVFDGETRVVNYGFNRVRFVAPVPSGARVRAIFALAGVIPQGPGAVDTVHEVTVEIEGSEKPALVAEWITRGYFGEN